HPVFRIEGVEQLTLLGTPKTDVVVLAAAGEPGAVWAKGQRADGVAVRVLQFLDRRRGLAVEVPQADAAVGPPRQTPVTLAAGRGAGHHLDRARMLDHAHDARARQARVPHNHGAVGTAGDHERIGGVLADGDAGHLGAVALERPNGALVPDWL